MNNSKYDRSTRLFQVDYFRGLAVLGMIETHVTNELIRNDLASSHGFQLLTQFNGLVAPGFLFVTGFILELRPPRSSSECRTRLKRFLLWIFLASAMHWPVWDGARSQIDFSPLLHFDILHCLGLSGAIQLALQRFERNRPLWPLIGAILSIVFLTPVVAWMAPAIPHLVAGLFVHNDNSRFPLFPWAGFLLCGALLCRLNRKLAQPALSASTTLPIALSTFVASLVLFIASAGLFSTGGFHFLTSDPRTDPAFFFARAFAVSALLAGLLRLQFKMTRRWLVWLEWLGKHSLAIYVIHLFLLFTILPFGESLVVHFGHTLDQTGLSLVATALLAATVSVVAVWQGIKRLTGLRHQG